MSALQLVPWIGSTYDRAQIRQWMIGAERLSAGVRVGSGEYPQPAHVSRLCEILLDACQAIQDGEGNSVTCEDPSDLVGSIGELIQAVKDERDAASKAESETRDLEDARDRAIKAEKERDHLQTLLDASEARCAAQVETMRIDLGAVDGFRAQRDETRAQLVRCGDALRLISDAIREDHPLAHLRSVRARKVKP